MEKIKKESLRKTWELFSLSQRQIGINPFNADRQCVKYETFEEFYSNFSSCLEEKNVYFRLNPVKEGKDWNRVWCCDSDISHREWILVDLDGEGHSSTEGEDQEGISNLEELREEVIQFLEPFGFPKPIIGFSGNGFHLLYKYDSILGDCNVSDFLHSLKQFYPQVDTRCGNPSRFTRLYGTINQKGKRQSEIFSIPQTIIPITSAHITSYLTKYPAPTITTTTKNKNGKKPSRFEKVRWTKEDDVFRDKFFEVYKSIPQFLKEYDLYLRTENYHEDGYKHILNCCPYQQHGVENETDCVIFDNYKQVRHTIRLSCIHETCGVDKDGNDLPGTKRFSDFVRYVVGDEEFERLFGEKEEVVQPLVEEEDNSKFIFNIKKRRKPEQEFFSTGFEKLDETLGGGLVQRGLTIITGKPGSGKSTFLNNVIWNTSSSVKSLVFTEQHTDDVATNLAKTYFSQPTVSEEDRDTALSELENKVVFYNKDNYTWDWRVVLEDINEFLSTNTDFKVVFLDNLSILCPFNSENTKEQQEFAFQLVKLAEEKNINISLVVHPSKNGEKVCGTSLFENISFQFLEVENISNNKQKLTKLNVLKNRDNGIKISSYLSFNNNRLIEVK